MDKKFIKSNFEYLENLLDCIQVGVYVTDSKGETLLVNEVSSQSGGLEKNQLIGKNIKELQEKGYIYNSVTQKVLKSKKEEHIIQSCGSGQRLYIIGIPLFKDGNIEMVICTERNIEEAETLKEDIKSLEEKENLYKREIEYLKNQQMPKSEDIVANHWTSKQALEQMMRIAPLDTTVLLTGESGVGKEVYANLIYMNSTRVNKPFMKINIAAIPENLIESELFGYEKGAFTDANKTGKPGIFELANGGTLFLDEIGDAPLNVQTKLLRVLQEKEMFRIGGNKPIEIDVRVLAATNKNLKSAIAEGQFREDLYYRLAVMPIEIMPLRARTEDIPDLTLTFVDKFNKKYNLSKNISNEGIELLKEYNWPGNIRELENIIERLMISFDGKIITPFQIKKVLGLDIIDSDEDFISNQISMQDILERKEKQILQHALEKRMKISDMARSLGINRTTLYRRLEKYDLMEKKEMFDNEQVKKTTIKGLQEI